MEKGILGKTQVCPHREKAQFSKIREGAKEGRGETKTKRRRRLRGSAPGRQAISQGLDPPLNRKKLKMTTVAKGEPYPSRRRAKILIGLGVSGHA